MFDELSTMSAGPAALWLIVALAAGVVELATPVFGFVFVSLGALVAAASAWLGVPFGGQIAVFAVTVLASLVLLRPRLVRMLDGVGVPSRVDALVGRRARVTVALDPLEATGRVLLDGVDWAARGVHVVPAGAEVVVRGADGIVLLVEPAHAPHA